MKSHISETPDKDAGEYIASVLPLHRTEHVLLLLSGGSALSILPHIRNDVLGNNLTIAFVDEHFTRDENGNNFLRLMQTTFYRDAREHGVAFLESIPTEFEKLHEFSARMREQFETYFSEHPHKYAIGIFGIGEDGHTAGIFPAVAEEFSRIYQSDETYVHVTQLQHPYPERTSITPSFIEEYIDEVILYAVGSNKCENILDYMYNKTFQKHEIPALIPASHPHSMLFTDCPSITP